MSRLGKKPIIIPEKTEINLNGSVLTVKGPKGELSLDIHPSVKIEIKDKELNVLPISETSKDFPLWGTFVSRISNMLALTIVE
jgi:large subunit ribosomal protein L6